MVPRRPERPTNVAVSGGQRRRYRLNRLGDRMLPALHASLHAALRVAIIGLVALVAVVLLGCQSAEEEPPAITIATATPTTTALASTVAPMPSPSPSPPPTPTPARVTIAFVGDVMLDRDVEYAMATVDVGYPFERAMPLFADADLVVANLEGTFTDVGDPLDKQYVFATAPALASGLNTVPIWAVSLSNNHATDYGLAGLDRTMEALDASGTRYFGAGAGENQARAPQLTPGGAAGVPVVAFLGYSAIGETIFASGATGGVARATAEAITENVTAARANPSVDFVVVTLHMGTEYSHLVNDTQRALAEAAIDAGADLVVGHHPHVLQPVEAYRGGLILYSLGNFVFDLDADDLRNLREGPFQSVVALVTFEVGATPTLELRPARIDVVENRPRPATEAEAAAILDLLAAD